MSWDDINFTELNTGCITTGYSPTSNRVSMVDVLNYLIDALNEKIYATQYNAFPSFITEKFEKGSILFNDNFINRFNDLFYKYWQLWSAHDWYSSGVLSDPVNSDDYLLTDADLIAATSQEFFDLISGASSPTFQDRWSGLFFQNIKTLYGLFRYCLFEYESPYRLAGRSGCMTVKPNDLITIRSGADRTPARLRNQAECTSMNDPALGFYSIDTIQSSAYNGLVADQFLSSQGFSIYQYSWGSGFGMFDFYNARNSSASYRVYRDGTRVYIFIKKYSTDELIYNVPYSMRAYVSRNQGDYVERTATVDGDETIITYYKYDDTLPDEDGEFDASIFNTASDNDATYGQGLSFFRDNGVLPFDEFEKNPPAQVCQNTSGKLRHYSEGHSLYCHLRNYLFVDSNNEALDYYIAP